MGFAGVGFGGGQWSIACSLTRAIKAGDGEGVA
jgi:hypothetical protein